MRLLDNTLTMIVMTATIKMTLAIRINPGIPSVDKPDTALHNRVQGKWGSKLYSAGVNGAVLSKDSDTNNPAFAGSFIHHSNMEINSFV